MKCDHKYEKISTPYTEAKVYSESVSEQQGGVYCDYDNAPCDECCFSTLKRKASSMDISAIKKGTFLTYTPKSTAQILYLVVKRVVTTKDGTIKIYTDMTHAYDSKGKYHGTDSYRAPCQLLPPEGGSLLDLSPVHSSISTRGPVAGTL